jgi:hypothetical protein
MVLKMVKKLNKYILMKKKLTSILLFCIVFGFAQEKVLDFELKSNKEKSAFQIVDEESKTCTLFLVDKKIVKSVVLNNEMKIIDSLSVNRPEKKFAEVIGCFKTNNLIKVFWNTSNKKEILVQNFDFITHQISSENISMEFKNQKILQNFSHNGGFYILTTVKESSILNLYCYQNGTFVEKSIDLKMFRFYNSLYSANNLYEVFEENLLPFEEPFSLKMIDINSPNSVTDSAKRRKCYLEEKNLIITLNTNFDFTQVLTIDLETFTCTNKYIKQEELPFRETNELIGNSFLIDKKLFQIKSSPNRLIYSIRDLDNNLIKKYDLLAGDPINFKNSQIIQENGDIKNRRVLENSNQFIRKMNNLNSGISVYGLNGDYMVTIGSVSEEQNPNLLTIEMFGLVGAIVYTALSNFNSTTQNFDAYQNRKVVYINCLFDKNGNHLEKNLTPTAFKKIRTFLSENNNINPQTVFKQAGDYYLGYYESKKKSFAILKFKD